MTSLGNQPAAVERVRIGSYLYSAHDLYRVEAVNGEHALIENCRSGDLIEMPLRDLRDLEPVQASARTPDRRRATP